MGPRREWADAGQLVDICPRTARQRHRNGPATVRRDGGTMKIKIVKTSAKHQIPVVVAR
jgi:hypothetical protein